MKKLWLFAVVLVLSLGFSSVSSAAVFMPPVNEPLFIQFSNLEQISGNGMIVSPTGVRESNWGIAEISSISLGNIVVDPQTFGQSTLIWAKDLSGGEITAIFGNVTPNQDDPTPGFNSMGGSIFLYWDDTPDADLTLLGTTPGLRGTVASLLGGLDFAYPNFADATDGSVLLAKIDFVAGAITQHPLTTITGSASPIGGGFGGNAESFGNVDLAAGGAWASLFDSNYFNTLLGANTADISFRNAYSNPGIHSWDAPGAGINNDIFGAQSSDPVRAMTTPEPATMLLLGSGLLGLLGFRRKKSK